MKKIKAGFLLMMMVLSQLAFAQPQGIEMADEFRADGKIYVVIAVVSVIVLGMVAYLITMDRKLKKLEVKLNEKRS